MKTRSILSALLFGASAALLPAAPASAQIEVPVSYELASEAPRIDGFLTGGSWCESEGLSVTRKGASSPAIVRYEDIDQLEALRLTAERILIEHDTPAGASRRRDLAKRLAGFVGRYEKAWLAANKRSSLNELLLAFRKARAGFTKSNP